MAKRMVIVGAGPIGLEAAVAASERGYETIVFEQGEVADAIRQWGHVRMFSPFATNISKQGAKRLNNRGNALPGSDELLTGNAFADRYLLPLAESLGGLVHTNAEVRAIARSGTGKMDKIGAASRSERPFRLLIAENGCERFECADLVFDCTGTFRTPNLLGDGGIPALGETRFKERIFYGIPDVNRFAATRVLVVGGGYSAATMVRDLSTVGATITWAVRKPVSVPCTRIAHDPLRERDRLAEAANRLATEIDFRPGASVYTVERDSSGFAVTLFRKEHPEIVRVDFIIAATGFRPDFGFGRELQLQTCWATEGTYKLAAALLGESGGDCLAVPRFGAETLLHPEPGYFTLGMKSYGRSPDFLIRTGLEQIDSVFHWLEQNR